MPSLITLISDRPMGYSQNRHSPRKEMSSQEREVASLMEERQTVLEEWRSAGRAFICLDQSRVSVAHKEQHDKSQAELMKRLVKINADLRKMEISSLPGQVE